MILNALTNFRDRDHLRLIDRIRNEPALGDSDHVAAYTNDTLIRLFDRSGFEVEFCRFTGFPSVRMPVLRFPIPRWIRRLPFLYSFGDDIVLKALSVDPNDRYSSAQEMRAFMRREWVELHRLFDPPSAFIVHSLPE